MLLNAFFVNFNSTPEALSKASYCESRELVGSVRTLKRSSSVKEDREARTGTLPTNSGIKPKVTRS